LIIADNFEKKFGRQLNFPTVKTFGELIDANVAVPAPGDASSHGMWIGCLHCISRARPAISENTAG
jgi:hypothetical protein